MWWRVPRPNSHAHHPRDILHAQHPSHQGMNEGHIIPGMIVKAEAKGVHLFAKSQANCCSESVDLELKAVTRGRAW